ncbi:MAG: hypothetical protein K8F36_10795 [Melioribacteraceae bacterium]|nr:hypothetical protein [Melioribacteraceae bacterium]
MRRESLTATAKIFGGIVFAFQALLFLFYWNWPFQSAEGKNYLPFILLGISMAGYIYTYINRRIGGLIIIAGGIGLSTNFLFANSKGEFGVELVLLLIILLPCVVSGLLFIITGSQPKNNSINSNGGEV